MQWSANGNATRIDVRVPNDGSRNAAAHAAQRREGLRSESRDQSSGLCCFPDFWISAELVGCDLQIPLASIEIQVAPLGAANLSSSDQRSAITPIPADPLRKPSRCVALPLRQSRCTSTRSVQILQSAAAFASFSPKSQNQRSSYSYCYSSTSSSSERRALTPTATECPSTTGRSSRQPSSSSSRNTPTVCLLHLLLS